MADSFIGKVLRGRYRVDSQIENGQYWALYRGSDLNVGRDVLIKLYPPELEDSKADLFAEARELSRIRHPNVLEVFDIGTDDDGTAYVIYEDFPGTSLRLAIRERGQFPYAEAVEIARQLAAANSVLTSARPVYGGLSTQNVLMGESGGLPLIKRFHHFSSTQAEYELPWPIDFRAEVASCAAPETFTDSAPDERADVYSIGAILYQMLAGDVPFAGTKRELIPQILEEPPAPLSSFRQDLPGGLETVVLTAMSKNPEMRYQTVSEFANAVSGGETAAAPAAAPEKKHELWKTAVVIVLGTILLASALIYASYTKQTNPSTRLQPDANGLPVQPINPATGAQELSLANLPTFDANSNANMAVPPGTIPGGDNYDPWKNGGMPPPGAPKIGPGGQVITIDPNNPSQFMPPEAGCVMQPSGILLCPVPLTNTAKPTPTPRTNAANANAAVPANAKPSPETHATPAANSQGQPPKTTATPKTTKTPARPGPGGAPSEAQPG
jgi:serine/threonine protein kinase